MLSGIIMNELAARIPGIGGVAMEFQLGRKDFTKLHCVMVSFSNVVGSEIATFCVCL